jgi:hypothetical protein
MAAGSVTTSLTSNSRALTTAAETVKAITGAGGKAFSFTLDVTERDKCRVDHRNAFLVV